jgi:hypothetical protein
MPSHHAPLALCLLLLGAQAHAEGEAPASSEPVSTVAATVERAALAERSQADARALERQLQENEQQQLKTAEEGFLALWLPANVAEPNGAVILLPGDDESADWPQSIGPLRRKLPDVGWHSLSLSLPDPQGEALPLRSAANADSASQPTAAQTDEMTGEPDPAEAAGTMPDDNQALPASIDFETALEAQRQAHAERVMTRIEAGIAFAQQQQAQTIVLLGHGSGAYWAARLLAERQPTAVQNLLLVAAELPEGFSPALDELIPGLKLATGDFYYLEQIGDRNAALKRMQASKRQKHPAYIQIAMQALPGNPPAEQEQLYRRIRGWLRQHLHASAQ